MTSKDVARLNSMTDILYRFLNKEPVDGIAKSYNISKRSAWERIKKARSNPRIRLSVDMRIKDVASRVDVMITGDQYE